MQADAKSVYDVLFGEPGELIDDAEVDMRKEVGCWSHGRRGFWEAASAKSEIGREGLARIGRFFDLEHAGRGSPPEVIVSLRRQHLRPHMEALAPKYWARTRARLNPVELAAEIGPLTVPSPQQQPATD